MLLLSLILIYLYICLLSKRSLLNYKCHTLNIYMYIIVIMELYGFVYIITNLACFVNGFYPRQPPNWTTKTHFDITNTGSLQAIANYIYQSKNTNASTPSAAFDEFFSSGKLNYIISLICRLHFTFKLEDKKVFFFCCLLVFFTYLGKCYVAIRKTKCLAIVIFWFLIQF